MQLSEPDSFGSSPDAQPSPPATGRWRRWLLALTLLVGLALGIGAGIAFDWVRSPAVTEVRVNASPVGGNPSAPEVVAAHLDPAVATVINMGSGTAGALGSGFVFSQDAAYSYLMTNNHVVTGATSLTVVMPSGDTFTHAKLVGSDSIDDIAVIRLSNPHLPTATLGDSSTLVPGQEVIAIGSPLGNQGSVTVGVISALHRSINASDQGSTATEQLEDVLQTDAAINPGNSGGPLADTNGDVVGVNVAVSSGSANIAYSIPITVAKRVAEEIVSGQKVQHPFLGVAYLDAVGAAEDGQPFNGPGVLVSTVEPNSPAATAGFHPGDVIISVNGTPLANGLTLGGSLEAMTDGQAVTFAVTRNGQQMTLTATLEERPAQ